GTGRLLARDSRGTARRAPSFCYVGVSLRRRNGHASDARCLTRRHHHRCSAVAAARTRQHPRLSRRRHRDRPGGAAPHHRCRTDRRCVGARRHHAALPDRPRIAAASPVGAAQCDLRPRPRANGADGAPPRGARLLARRHAVARRRDARRGARFVIDRDRPADAARARDPVRRLGARCFRGAAVPGHDLRAAGRARSHGDTDACDAGAVGNGGQRHRRDPRHLDRRDVPGAAAVQPRRRSEDARGLHGDRAAARRRHGGAGLSASLGAFMAGVLLSDSEYRHELQADIQPFEGLLLGFFFISVGMSANLQLAQAQPLLLAGATATLLVVKAAIAFVLARIARHDRSNSLRFALALPQASEFSFVLFGAAVAAGALNHANGSIATLATAASMVATPILFAGAEAALRLRPSPPPQYDAIDAGPAPVILCGFGRFGQIIGRVLHMHGIAFTALERDPGQVEVVRRFGIKVYFGDPTRPDMLRAAGAETARLIIVAMDAPPGVLRTVEMVKQNFPNLAILARARNRWQWHLLMDREVDGLVRDTFHSSLKLAKQALVALGIAEDATERGVMLFRDHDERTLQRTHAIYRDEK